jgi:hypothetical protein
MNRRMRVCYLDCQEAGLRSYLAIDTETYYVHYIDMLRRRAVTEIAPYTGINDGKYRHALLAQIRRINFILICRFRSQENDDQRLDFYPTHSDIVRKAIDYCSGKHRKLIGVRHERNAYLL